FSDFNEFCRSFLAVVPWKPFISFVAYEFVIVNNTTCTAYVFFIYQLHWIFTINEVFNAEIRL
ncbi:hypothetical protein PMAYCL1PPCAC_19423, partial [Pristionchus mayeri]